MGFQYFGGKETIKEIACMSLPTLVTPMAPQLMLKITETTYCFNEPVMEPQQGFSGFDASGKSFNKHLNLLMKVKKTKALP